MNGILGLVVLIAYVVALLDCWKSDEPTNTKLLWTLLIIILPLIGTIAYFVVGKKKA